MLAPPTAKPTIENTQRRTSAKCSAITMRTRTNVSERHNNLLAPPGNDRVIPASMRFSNTAVQYLLVQQPVQQRRRTERSSVQHTMHTGEHQRTGCVESPLRHSEEFQERLKQGYKKLEAFLFWGNIQLPGTRSLMLAYRSFQLFYILQGIIQRLNASWEGRTNTAYQASLASQSTLRRLHHSRSGKLRQKGSVARPVYVLLMGFVIERL